MNYSWTVPIALFGFVPFTLFLFAWLGSVRAVIASFLLGYLLLPVAVYKIQGFPGWDKTVATSLSCLLGAVLFDSRRFATFRPSWIDVPMAVWCAVQMVTSLSNNLGYWDGQSQFVGQVLICGIPYFLGRLYIGSADGLRRFAIAYVIGGLLYIPPCLFEVRMSPQLHSMLYGFQQHSFLQSFRLGGWRPTVFLEHGLAVGLLMSTAAAAAVWLWRTGAARRIAGIPVGVAAAALLVVAVACKSSGAIALLVAALIVLWCVRSWRVRNPLLILIAVAPAYMLARTNSLDLGTKLVELANMVSGQRAESLSWRMQSEEVLARHALERPILGWGTWGRNLVDHYGAGPATPDARWVVYFGVNGFVGLISWTAAALLPAYLIILRMPSRLLSSADGAPIVIACVIQVLFVIDSLLNANQNPAYMLLAGGLAGFAVRRSARGEPRIFTSRGPAVAPPRAGQSRPDAAARSA